MVAYVDSRIVQDLLDEVVGIGKWQDKYYEVKGNVYCSIGIKCGEDWIWKSDCGTAGNIETEKSEASDAFKRAAVKWGIARFLYSLPKTKLKTKQHTNKKFYPVDAADNILWDGETQTKYCMSLSGKTPPKAKGRAKKLPPMNEHEIDAMKQVWLMTKALKPQDKTDETFKQMIMGKLYEKMGHWPTTQQEQEEAINILDKEFRV